MPWATRVFRPAGRTGRWRAGALLLLAAAPVFPAEPATDAEVKAAFVFNFIRYTEWPDSGPGAPVVICHAGGTPGAVEALRALEGRQVKGRTLKVQRIGDDPAGCQVLVAGEGANTAALLRNAQARPTLTVGDGWGFLEEGGVMALAVVDGRVAFGANLDAAHRANLRLSAPMLKLARRVLDGGGR